MEQPLSWRGYAHNAAAFVIACPCPQWSSCCHSVSMPTYRQPLVFHVHTHNGAAFVIPCLCSQWGSLCHSVSMLTMEQPLSWHVYAHNVAAIVILCSHATMGKPLSFYVHTPNGAAILIPCPCSTTTQAPLFICKFHRDRNHWYWLFSYIHQILSHLFVYVLCADYKLVVI